MNAVEFVAQLLIPAAAGLGGVILGAWLTAWNERRRRRLDYIEQQLRELYAPLLGIRKHVRALSELRVRMEAVSDDVWRELCNEAQERGGAQALQRLREDRLPAFKAAAERGDEQWRTQLFPSYKLMLTIFQEKYWLAEDQTRAHFQKFIDFVEFWESVLNKTLPFETIPKLEVREAELEPLYLILEQTFQDLRRKLSSGKG